MNSSTVGKQRRWAGQSRGDRHDRGIAGQRKYGQARPKIEDASGRGVGRGGISDEGRERGRVKLRQDAGGRGKDGGRKLKRAPSQSRMQCSCVERVMCVVKAGPCTHGVKTKKGRRRQVERDERYALRQRTTVEEEDASSKGPTKWRGYTRR